MLMMGMGKRRRIVVPGGGGFGTVRTDALGGSSGGNATVTFRHVFAAAGLTAPSGTPTQMRITFHAGTSGGENWQIDKAYVGHKAAAGDAYDAASLTQITFDGGSGSVTITSGTTKLSDTIAFAWDKVSDLVISYYQSNASADSIKRELGLSNVLQYTVGGDEAAAPDASSGGWTLISGRNEGIFLIEADGF